MSRIETWTPVGAGELVRDPRAEFIADVRAGLGHPAPRTLPSRWLYDDVGSALFDAICRLPEYGLTRADERILRGCAAELAQRVERPVRIVELGSGSGGKTRPVLEAFARRGRVRYVPIDVSAAALARCAGELAGIPGATVHPFEGDYFDGLRAAAAERGDGRLLVLFLGSTIGNFDRDVAEGFLGEVRRSLRAGDALLLGTDLVKPVERIVLAYDDPAGVTAAFDKNVLARINRELVADFDLSAFAHEARWNAAECRVEMHLRALRDQQVRISAAWLDVAFTRGETIWTESSHKFAPDAPAAMGACAGFRAEVQWRDREWAFAETLLVARD